MDFVIPERTFIIAPEVTEAQINLSILDDNIPEDIEAIELEVTARISGITFPPVKFTPMITILDNDGKT